ncbi:MAG: Flp pilus assembly protein CpaB [Terriglobales bacterium]
MNRSRLLMIGGLALAIGLLVSYAVYDRLRAHGAGEQQFAQVVVAANDIQIGSRLSDHDVRLATFPQASIPPGAYSRVSQVRDRGVVMPISRGDFILPDKLADANAGAGLPSMIPQGMRAVSVRVNDVVSVAGFVQPGTRVDVLATGIHGAGENQTSTVLENVAVIAVGRSLLDRMTGDVQNAGVITLLVSPDDAQKLTLASQEGRIQLALRNPLDTRKESLNATKTSSLLPAGQSAPAPTESKPRVHKVVEKTVPPPPPTPYQVEMIRGGKRDETKFKPDGNN